MKPYLQRLYDAAAGTATAVEARPAQRSSSPLLAVDQRLASPAYAASFLLGLPGSAEPEPTAPEPDLLAVPEPVRRDPEPAPDDAPVQVRAPRLAAATPQASAEERVVDRPHPDGDQGPQTRPRPPATSSEILREPTPVAPAPAPAAHPIAAPVETRTRPVVELAQRPELAPLPPAEPRPVPPGAEPTRPAEPGLLRVVPETPPRPQPERPRPDAAAPPRLLHPAPVPMAEPLPPAPPPPATEPADLADQVRRLVREAMAGEDTSRRPSRDGEAGTDAAPASTAARARTAEAVSVIGPLDRPARATTLYGLRLR